jgi:hypothetical protein
VHAHAAFQAQRLVEGAALDALATIEIDLDQPAADCGEPPPF